MSPKNQCRFPLLSRAIALLAAAVLALAASPVLGQTIAQGPIQNPANGHGYYRLSPSTWTQAEAAAVALHGHLVTINDAVENTFVLDNFCRGAWTGAIWLGYTDRAVEGTFVWMNGENPGYTNWDSGEPNNGGGNEDYTIMYSGNGRWADVGDLASPPGVGSVCGVVEVPNSTGSDACEAATLISANSTVAFSCVGATTGGPAASGSCLINNDVWFRYVACVTGSHTLTTCGLASFDTCIQVLTGPCDALSGVVCNDDACGVQSSVTWNALAGTTYYLRIGAFEGAPGSGAIELSGPLCQQCPGVSVVKGPIINPANGHTYYLLSPSSWSCAELYAVTQLGGHLVALNDQTEGEWVFNTFINNPGQYRSLWLGLTNYVNNGIFVHTNGDPVTFTRWPGGNAPQGTAPGVDFVYLSAGESAPTGYWGVTFDSGDFYQNLLPAGVVEVPTHECPAISVLQGPIVNPANGHGYYLLSSSDWSCAEAYAVTLGGHLVTINDAAENAFVYNTFSNGGARHLWLGCNDRDAEGAFTWTSGEISGYMNWVPGEPNNSTPGEDYALMYSDAWVDATDTAAANFFGVVEVPGSTGSNDCVGAPTITYGNWGFSTLGATTDGPQSCNILYDVWFKFTACVNGSHNVTTCGFASFDTALQVLTGSCGAMTSMGCNDDACGLQSSVTWNAVAGTTYYVRVGAFEGSGGRGSIELTGPACQSCPAISVVQGPVVNPVNGHRYYRLSPSSWSCAELYAVNQLGGHLVSLNDVAEDTFVFNTFVGIAGSGPVWLGLNDVVTPLSFAYTNGDAVSYTRWGSGQPDNASGIERVVCMYIGGGPWGNGNWVDVQDSTNPGVGNVSGVVEVPALPCAPITVIQGPVINPANGHTYYRLSSSNWTCAELYASSQLGGHLVTINDAAENTFVYNTFANISGGGAGVWIGLNDAVNEGTFTYVSGDPVGYAHWYPGEPNNYQGNEDYVFMYAANGFWNDYGDVASQPGVGSIYGVVEVPTAPCPAISVVQGPIVNPANGHTYYRLSSSNWTCAEWYAMTVLNGHLATINNAAENTWVQTTFANVSGSGVWLGYTDLNSEGTFTWRNGENPGYTNWSPGEPNNFGGNEDYTLMSSSGTWNDYSDSPGNGNIFGVVEVATVFCPGDFNHSGSLNVQDIFDFLTAWFSASPSADFNHANGITVQDIFDYLAAWFAGC